MNLVFQFFTENPVIAGFLVLVLIEQVLLLFPGTYPYTLGFPVKIIPIDIEDERTRELLVESLVRKRCRVRISGSTVYFRKMLPEGVWGPQLLIGQILLEGRNRAIIRMAPIALLGIAYLFLMSIGEFTFSGIFFALIVAVLVYLFIRWYVRKISILF
ncbi:hypothetical protein MUP29_02235 [bacterium]|nr:hypothetical protein [bacterium]